MINMFIVICWLRDVANANVARYRFIGVTVLRFRLYFGSIKNGCNH